MTPSLFKQILFWWQHLQILPAELFLCTKRLTSLSSYHSQPNDQNSGQAEGCSVGVSKEVNRIRISQDHGGRGIDVYGVQATGTPRNLCHRLPGHTKDRIMSSGLWAHWSGSTNNINSLLQSDGKQCLFGDKSPALPDWLIDELLITNDTLCVDVIWALNELCKISNPKMADNSGRGNYQCLHYTNTEVSELTAYAFTTVCPCLRFLAKLENQTCLEMRSSFKKLRVPIQIHKNQIWKREGNPTEIASFKSRKLNSSSLSGKRLFQPIPASHRQQKHDAEATLYLQQWWDCHETSWG